MQDTNPEILNRNGDGDDIERLHCDVVLLDNFNRHIILNKTQVGILKLFVVKTTIYILAIKKLNDKNFTKVIKKLKCVIIK